jgi:hypothetical protein
MTRTIKATAIIATLIATTASSAFAMDSDQATIKELKGLGYSDAVVAQLDHAELATLEAAMHNGDDADQRQSVRTLMFNFSK